MLTPPVAAWIAYNTFGAAASAIKAPRDGYAGFGFSVVVSIFSCSFLTAGELGNFLGLELGVWFIQVAILALVIAIYQARGDAAGAEGEEIIASANSASLGCSARVVLAFITWLCAGGTLSDPWG